MSLQTQRYTYTFTAGETKRLDIQGEFYKITAATGAVSVRRDTGGSKISGLLPGQGERAAFGHLVVTDESGAANTITILCGAGEFIDDRPVLVVPNGPVTHTAPAVTNASTTLLAAKGTRQFLYVQNNDGAGIVWLSLDGTAAVTGAPCIKLGPGQGIAFDNFVSTGAVKAIGSIGNNPNVSVIEG